MGQSKFNSLLESCVNSTVSAFLYVVVVFVFHTWITQDTVILLWITFVVSIVKNYIIRRIGDKV